MRTSGEFPISKQIDMDCPSGECGRLFDLSDIYDINGGSDKKSLLLANAHQMGETAQNRAQSGKFPLITIVIPAKF